MRPWVPWKMVLAVVIWLIGFAWLCQPVGSVLHAMASGSGITSAFKAPVSHVCTPAEVCNSSVLKDLRFVPPTRTTQGELGCSPQLATLCGSPLSSPVLLPGILDFSWKF